MRKHLGNNEETLTLNVSRMFPRLRTVHISYAEDVGICILVLLPFRLLTHAAMSAILTQNVPTAMFLRLHRP